jgi:hypothetical protein
MNRRVHSLLLFLLLFSFLHAQNRHNQLIQFSGIVVSVDKDSVRKVPFASIILKSSLRGTISDYYGYFAFVAQPGDTIIFNALGFRENMYFIPDTLSTDKYSLVHVMLKDTTLMQEVTIYPWPSKEAFKKAFLDLNLPSTDLDRAKRNLILAEAKAHMQGMPMDAHANFINTMQQEYNRLYWAGQFPPDNLLNPLAWAQFLQAWKNGTLNFQ